MIKVQIEKTEPTVIIRLPLSKARDLYICADRVSEKAVAGFFIKTPRSADITRIVSMFLEIGEALEKEDLGE